jgi:hypothetical protein
MVDIIDGFVDKNVPDVQRFAVEKLARILYECAEHSEPRQITDWITAEKHVNQNIQSVSWADLTKQYLMLTAYEELRKTKPELAPADIRDLVSRSNCSGRELSRIGLVLASMQDSEMDQLIGRLDENQRRTYQERFLGRAIWNEFYQTIRRSSLLGEMGYSKIRFG